MAEFPALPLFTDAYLADCGHLSDEEHGRYLLLLLHCWRSPQCRLPNDDEWLARRFNRSVERVRSELRPLLAEFFDCTGNWLTQKRLQREREFVLLRCKKQRDRAKSRWEKEKGECRGNAPTPTPTPIPIEEKERLLTEPKESASPAGSADAEPAPKPKVREPNGTSLPADWKPTPEDRDFARLEGMIDADVDRIADQFRDYWLSEAGQRARKRSWAACWRNWIRREAQRPRVANFAAYQSQRGASGSSPPRPGGIAAAAAACIARRRTVV